MPEEDLARFSVSREALVRRSASGKLRELLAFEAARVRDYYRQSAPLVQMVNPGSRASLRALISICSRLLDPIAASGYEVLAQCVRVPAWEKVWILARSLV